MHERLPAMANSVTFHKLGFMSYSLENITYKVYIFIVQWNAESFNYFKSHVRQNYTNDHKIDKMLKEASFHLGL